MAEKPKAAEAMTLEERVRKEYHLEWSSDEREEIWTGLNMISFGQIIARTLLEEAAQIVLTHPTDHAEQDAILRAGSVPLMFNALRESIAARIRRLAGKE